MLRLITSSFGVCEHTLDLCLTPIVTVTLPDHPAEILNDAKLTAGS